MRVTFRPAPDKTCGQGALARWRKLRLSGYPRGTAMNALRTRLPQIVAATLLSLARATSASAGECSQPLSSGADPVVSDCLFILQSAVGQHACVPGCICDPNGGGIASSDSLLCLRKSVGQEVALECDCTPTTTVTSSTLESPPTTLPFGSMTITGCVEAGVECYVMRSGGQLYSLGHPDLELGKCYEVTGSTWGIAGICMQGMQMNVRKVVEADHDCCAAAE